MHPGQAQDLRSQIVIVLLDLSSNCQRAFAGHFYSRALMMPSASFYQGLSSLTGGGIGLRNPGCLRFGVSSWTEKCHVSVFCTFERVHFSRYVIKVHLRFNGLIKILDLCFFHLDRCS